jgi:hypothetical protein
VKTELDIDGRIILKVYSLEIYCEDINWDELAWERVQ